MNIVEAETKLAAHGMEFDGFSDSFASDRVGFVYKGNEFAGVVFFDNCTVIGSSESLREIIKM